MRLIINTNRAFMRLNSYKALLYQQNYLVCSKYPFSVYERYFTNKCVKGCILYIY